MRILSSFARNVLSHIPTFKPDFIDQDQVSTTPTPRPSEGSGLITQQAGVPQASAPFAPELMDAAFCSSEYAREMQALAHAIVNSPDWIKMDIDFLEEEIEEAYTFIIDLQQRGLDTTAQFESINRKRNEINRLRVKLVELSDDEEASIGGAA